MIRPELAAAMLVLLPVVARAQDIPVSQVSWRYDEDWSVLRHRDPDTLPAWAAFKYQPLSSDGSVWISAGMEARARFEGYRENEWSSAAAPDDNVLWMRLMPHIDLHAGPARLFVQGIAGYAFGLDPPPAPSDETGVDLLQGFGEATLRIGDASVHLRGGRELMALGSERLVGARYGPNIPQPFDGARVIADVGSARLQAFALRPTDIGPGDFDDSPSDTERISGAYATVRFDPTDFDVYVLDYRNRDARFDQGGGAEERQTYGLRIFGGTGRWDWNWEAMLQRGHFAGSPIRAWSLASETSYRLDAVELRLRANIVSGDRDPDDPELQTFNPMFPKGKYFGELTPIGPYNIINLHPNADFHLGHDLTLGLAAIAYWRESREDGIYGVAGNIVRSGRGSNARHIGNQAEVMLSWDPDPLVSVSASYSFFAPGAFIEETGPSETIHMIAMEARFRL